MKEQKFDLREWWWIKLPLFANTDLEWSNAFEREVHPKLCAPHNGANEWATTEFQIGDCPAAVISSQERQNLDLVEYLLLPAAPIKRQSFTKPNDQKGDAPIEIKHSQPTQPTAEILNFAQKVKVWLKHGVNYKAILAYRGGYIVTPNPKDPKDPFYSCLGQHDFIIDTPFLVQGRTMLANSLYAQFKRGWEEMYPKDRCPTEQDLLDVFKPVPLDLGTSMPAADR